MDNRTQRWDAKRYQEKHAFVWRYGRELLALLNAQTGERILDVGCGTGQLTAEIAELGATVVGIDRSIEMIAAAKKNFPQLRFEVVDAAQLSFDNEFDAVFSNAALHWVRDSQGAVASVARALKPGGRFVFEMGGSGNIRTLWSTIVEALRSLGLEQAERLSPWYYPSVAGYATLLESQGLEVTFATLFDRPTALDGGELGLRTWIETMGNFLLQTIPPDQRETFVCRVETLARPALFHDGVWSADYRRLRMIARKVQPEA